MVTNLGGSVAIHITLVIVDYNAVTVVVVVVAQLV